MTQLNSHSQNDTTASRQWASRPDDQRFLSIAELKNAVQTRKNESWTATPACADLRAIPIGNDIAIEVYDPVAGQRRELTPSNWSFGQLCGYAGAPASYLRKQPAQLACINMQWGLENIARREQSLILGRSNGQHELRAMTSQSYGRVWDIDIVNAVEAVNQDGRWQIPAASYAATNPRRASTLYASDRDIFVFLVDDKNPIDVPQNGGRVKQMRRGFYAWNSEVGSAKWGFKAFLYDFVCDNRIIWGCTTIHEVSGRHTGGAPERFKGEAAAFLPRYANEGTTGIVSQIQAAQNVDLLSKINTGKGDTIETWLQARGFTKSESKASVEAANVEEGGARSLWDVINGVTAYARTIPHSDDRVILEARAGKLLADATK